MRVTITRCELVPGTPPPPEIPEGVDRASLPTIETKDRYGQPVTEIASYGVSVSYFDGDHFEVEAEVSDGDRPTWNIQAEFEGSYPVDEIPKAMLQRAKQDPESVVGTVVEG